MKPSTKGINFIANEEGLRLEAYKDQAGIWTIGYGTIEYEDGVHVKKGDKITKDRAIKLLQYEVDLKTKGINRAMGGMILNQNQFDACVSIAYNIGTDGFAGSTLLKRIKKNPCDPSIRDAFLMWDKIHIDGKLVKNSGLSQRRGREADLYFSTT